MTNFLKANKWKQSKVPISPHFPNISNLLKKKKKNQFVDKYHGQLQQFSDRNCSDTACRFINSTQQSTFQEEITTNTFYL